MFKNVKTIILLMFILPIFSQSNLKKIWKFETNKPIISTPSVDNNVIYFGSNDNTFYAVEAGTGKKIWEFKTGGRISGGALIYENSVCFVSGDGYLYNLDKNNGKEIWKFLTKGEAEADIWDYYFSKPVLVNNLICFGSGDKHIYGINKADGKKMWGIETQGIVHSTAAVDGDNIYLGSFDGNMYAINTVKGELLWKFKTVGNLGVPTGAIPGSAEIVNKLLFFGSRDYNLYAVNLKTGTGAFNDVLPSWIIAKPVYHNGQIFFGNSDGPEMFSYSTKTGEQLWKIPVSLNIFADVVIYKNYAVYSSFNGKIYFVDQKTGKINFEWQTDNSIENFTKVFDEKGKVKEEHYKKLENIKTREEMIKAYHSLYNVLYFSLGSIVATPLINEDVIYIPTTEGSLYACRIIE